jgi:2-polyprenyl-3-methyl-5-hydroxy-6-metoxy-1,4-benzoquinol methylase
MINKRYTNDGVSLLKLNKVQQKIKQEIEAKIESKKYTFEYVKCVICQESDFEKIAEKDRYGLYVPTVICKTCGLLQTNPRMTQESYNEFYDKEYRTLYGGEEFTKEQFFDSQIRHGKDIIKYIEGSTGKKVQNKFVIEVGTGAGGILKAFQEKSNKVFGLDLGSEYIEFGKKKGIPQEVGTIAKLKNQGEKADIIVYSHVVEHILDPEQEFKELKKYIKDDAIVYIEVPGVRHLTKSYDQDLLEYLQNAHTYHFTLTALRNLMQKAGYKIVSGNENINAIFMKSEENNKYQNEYEETKKFLLNLEEKRKRVINPVRLKRQTLAGIIQVTKKLGVYKEAKNIYHKMRYRK